MSRASGRTRFWRVATLLAGVLTTLVGGLAVALPPVSGGKGPALHSSDSSAEHRASARSKLLQARAQLAQGNLDAAEALAQEVARLQIAYDFKEDTPEKVLQDVRAARRDPKALLQAARGCLTRKEFDRAEDYAKEADKAASLWTFPLWGDSPAKALRDIESARKAAGVPARVQAPTRPGPKTVVKNDSTPKAMPVVKTRPEPTPVAKTRPDVPAKSNPVQQVTHTRPVTPSKETASSDIEKTRALLKAGRQSLQAGKLDEAKKLAAQARSSKAGLGWWEDNPDRLEADIRRAEAAARNAAGSKTMAKTTQVPPATRPVSNVPRDKAEATKLLALGRKQLGEGKLDDAAQTAQRIKALTTASWGLFEDSPDRLQIDIDKARVKRDREEAGRCLVEGRKLYQKGDYEGATRLAYKAQKLHGPYSIWDLGDRPSKLLADVQTSQAKSRKTALPPAAVARNTTTPKGPSTPRTPTSPTPTQPRDTSVARVTPPARPTTPAPGTTGTQPTVPAPQKPPETGIVRNTVPPDTTAPLPTIIQAPPANKLRAQQLVAEAQRLHTEGKLVEARQKTIEAQRLGAFFAADETSPEMVYQAIATDVRKRVESLMNQANDTMAYGKGELSERMRLAEARLTEAKQLAGRFGQDVRPIDARLVELRNPKLPSDRTVAQATHTTPAIVNPTTTTHPVVPSTPPVPTHTPTPVPPPLPPVAVRPDVPPAPPVPPLPPVPPIVQAEPARPAYGQQLLENARAELRKGETSTARRLAEEALKGNHGVRDEALAVLRTVDAEEENQKRLEANRAFDAARSAFNRREYSRASAILGTIDIRRLDTERQARLREISLTPEMSALARNNEKLPSSGDGVVRTGGNGPTIPGTGTPSHPPVLAADTGTGRARASDAPDGGMLDRHRQMQKILMDKLRQEGLDVQKDAAEKFRAGQHEVAIDLLQEHLNKLSDEKLESSQLALLKRPVESRLSHFRLLKSQKDLSAGVLASRNAAQERVDSSRRAEDLKRKNVEKLMRDFNALFKEGKYAEAEALAMRAHDLDPDNGIVSAAVYMARRQRNINDYKGVKERRERFFLDAANDADDVGNSGAIKAGVEFPKDNWDRVHKRPALTPIKLNRQTENQRIIERKLSTPVTLNFESATLQQVLNDLRDIHGLNIVEDRPALSEAGISLDSPVSIKLDQVSLKSALNLLLHQVHLTYVIKHDVLLITTEENAKGKCEAVTYQVSDLVIPVENFGDFRTGPAAGSPTSLLPGTNTTVAPPSPAIGPSGLVGGTPVGSPTGPGSSMLNGAGSPTGAGGGTGISKKNANTTEEQLIKLITSTIAPRSWSEMGGPGTIEYFPLTMSLVINQTPDIQEQVQDLLAALRRLIDQEVAVEVRMITVSEDFFERIGVNFNLNILTDKANVRFEPALLNNSFVVDSNRFINAFDPKRFLAGLTPAGTLTPTLDIPITQSHFFQTVPNFGGYTPSGIATGIAFLSDIQVFLFMEAVQGDQRANVMQAPKLTMFNGQTAQLTVGDTQSFVSGVQVAQVGGGQFAIIPQVNPQQNGVSLTVQPVISADRRFVRLSIQPLIQNLVPGPVQTFPVVVPIFTSIEGNQAGQPVVFTQFLQLPIQTFVTVQTTVLVPDGGTVLMGGLKRLSEARSEYGTPILSKIPYINRLFKNVGYGRETDSLLLMVTPRIIVQEEEEERQTGFRTPSGVGG